MRREAALPESRIRSVRELRCGVWEVDIIDASRKRLRRRFRAESADGGARRRSHPCRGRRRARSARRWTATSRSSRSRGPPRRLSPTTARECSALRGDSGLRRRLDKPRRGGGRARVGRVPAASRACAATGSRPSAPPPAGMRSPKGCAPPTVLRGPVRRSPAAQEEAPDLPGGPQGRAGARRIRIRAFRRGHRARPRVRPQARRDLRDTRRRPRCGAHDRHRPRDLAGEHRRAELLRRISRALRDAAAGMARRRAALLGRRGRIQAAAREERPTPRRGTPQERHERAAAHRGRRMHALRAQAAHDEGEA